MSKSPSEVTVGELMDFLNDRGVTGICNACGQNKLSVAVNDESFTKGREAPAVHVQVTLSNNPFMGYGQYLQACLNCGYIRYFRDFEVLEFLEGRSDNER